MTAIGTSARVVKGAPSSLFAALGFGLSGAAFTLGMLLLARVLRWRLMAVSRWRLLCSISSAC